MKRYLTPEMEIEFFDGQDLFAMQSMVEGGGSACMGDLACSEDGGGFVQCPGEFECGDDYAFERCPAEFSM